MTANCFLEQPAPYNPSSEDDAVDNEEKDEEEEEEEVEEKNGSENGVEKSGDDIEEEEEEDMEEDEKLKSPVKKKKPTVLRPNDSDNLELSSVVPMKPKIIRDSQEDVEDCTDIPSFTNGLPLVEEIDDLDDDSSHLLRLDVEWTRV